MDELADVISRAMFDEPLGELHPFTDAASIRAASAVRASLVSDEVVERAASAMAGEVHMVFKAFDDRTRSKYLRQARAALTAAVGDGK